MAKKQIMWGMVITAFIAALTISNLLPGFLVALIIVIAGLLVSYYVALDQKKNEHMSRLYLLVEAFKTINSEPCKKNIFLKLLRFINYTLEAEYSGIYLLHAEEGSYVLDNKGKKLNDSDLKKIIAWIKDNPGTLIINNQQPGPVILEDNTIKSLLVASLQNNEDILGVVYIVNKENGKLFNEQDQKLSETLCNLTFQAIDKLQVNANNLHTFHSIIKSLITAIELRDKSFVGHSERVAETTIHLGKRLGLNEEELRTLEYAALLHDIGRAAIPGEILDKPDQLTNDEYKIIEKHTIWGDNMIPASRFFYKIKEGILYHHERYDGTGYPEGLKKTDIPFIARIIAVADVYDAMTAIISNNERITHEQALTTIKKFTGTAFDPLVVTAFIEIESDIKNTYATRKDIDSIVFSIYGEESEVTTGINR